MPDRRPRFFVLAGAAYVGLRLAVFLPSETRIFPDTGTYLHTARESLLSDEFWAGWRPWTTPLLYKLVPDSDAARAAGQLVISIACWLALAAAVAWNVRRPGFRVVAFCLVLVFSLSVWITQWDRVLLSESLSVSLAAAVLAAWLTLVRAPNWWAVAAVLGTMLLWAFSRDAHPFLALMAVPFVLGWMAMGGWRRGGIVLAVGLAAIFGAGTLAQSTPDGELRETFAMLSVIGVRVLTDPDELRYFREHGMPLPEAVRVLAGDELEELRPGGRLEQDPRAAGFLHWVREDGRDTLARYLVTHPYRAVKPVVEDAEALLATEPPFSVTTEPLDSYRAEGTDPLLPGPVEAAAYPPSLAAVLVWLAVVIAAAAWLATLGLARPIWLVPAAALLLQIPHAALVWHGNAVSITRHALAVGVVTRAGLLVLSIFLIDAVLERRRDRA